MPSGKVHAIATCVAAGTLSPVVYLAAQSIPAALAFAGGCMVGLVVTPDLDVRDRDTHSETIMRHARHCLGAIWNVLWWPYARLIPRHRHPLSHWPILGTVLRLVYLLMIPVFLWWGLGRLVSLPSPLPVLSNPLTWWAIGGLALVDVLHWGMDRAW
jgi:uncharacterized metal-binding protein